MNKILLFIFYMVAMGFVDVAPSFSSNENLRPSFDYKVGKKHLKHHYRLKPPKNNTNADSDSQGSQEEVTDQREVSQQSDQTGHKNK